MRHHRKVYGLIYLLFYCRMAPCQLHIIQKERNEEQLTDSSYAWEQKEDVKQLLVVVRLDVRSFLFKKLYNYYLYASEIGATY